MYDDLYNQKCRDAIALKRSQLFTPNPDPHPLQATAENPTQKLLFIPILL